MIVFVVWEQLNYLLFFCRLFFGWESRLTSLEYVMASNLFDCRKGEALTLSNVMAVIRIYLTSAAHIESMG